MIFLFLTYKCREVRDLSERAWEDLEKINRVIAKALDIIISDGTKYL